MLQLTSAEILQLIAWSIALLEFIFGLYILALNIWHPANRNVGMLLLIFAINTSALGILVATTNLYDAFWPTLMLAMTTPASLPGLLLISIILLKPNWFANKNRVLQYGLYALVLLPILLTLSDWLLNTGLWFTPLTKENFEPGFLQISKYTNGPLGVPLRYTLLYSFSILTPILVGWVAIFDKKISPQTRKLAYFILATLVSSLVINYSSFAVGGRFIPILLTNTVYAFGFGYAGFWQLLSERRTQRGQITTRITVFALVITIPVLVAISMYSNDRTEVALKTNSVQRLNEINQRISENANAWFSANTKALELISGLPAIQSMDPALQKPVLDEMGKIYPEMYLISTIGTDGINLARSDSAPPADYSDRDYVQSVLSGAPYALQTLIGRTSKQPALVAAQPILGANHQILGISMFATSLDTLSTAIQLSNIGNTGMAFIVDANNQVLAHPNPQFVTDELTNLSTNPAVAALRNSGPDQIIRYRDNSGELWIATANVLDNGWGIIVQQQEREILAESQGFRTVTTVITTLGIMLIGSLIYLSIRQATTPILSLTDTATAISAGDFTKVAPIESEDEFGVLARSFNQMTAQLLDLINSLEDRITERTQNLEKRTTQLQAAADVGRAAATVLDLNTLFEEAVYAIRDRFNLYYVGLFLVDDTKEWAYLRTGTGEAGQAMLTRRHRIRVGSGMIGWSIANALPRIAQEAGEDAVRLATEELPETRSEAAIPLRARGLVLGAITIQDNQPDAFDEDTITIFQTMADLVSIAINNAQLYTDAQDALATAQRAYGQISQNAWLEAIEEGRGITLQASQTGIQTPETMQYDANARLAWESGKTIQKQQDDNFVLMVPIKIREAVIGILNTYKPIDSGQWGAEEINMVETIIEQMGVALESARLFEDTQRKAEREETTHQLTDRIHRAGEIESLMSIIVQEVAEALGASSSFIQLSTLPEDDLLPEIPAAPPEEPAA